MENVVNDQVTLKLVDICLTTCYRCYVNPCYALQKNFGRLTVQKPPKMTCKILYAQLLNDVSRSLFKGFQQSSSESLYIEAKIVSHTIEQ